MTTGRKNIHRQQEPTWTSSSSATNRARSGLNCCARWRLLRRLPARSTRPWADLDAWAPAKFHRRFRGSDRADARGARGDVVGGAQDLFGSSTKRANSTTSLEAGNVHLLRARQRAAA
jgi:hypothetical protein